MTDDDTAMLEAIERWADREVRPIARQFDHADEYPVDLVEQMKELGLFGATIGKEYGGLGLSASTYARIVTLIASAWMAPTGIFNSHLIMAACVERYGTDEQKQQFLPRFATGELRGGLALTEPNAGTDLQAIRTRAEPDSTGGYRVNGTKTWITNGVYGTCFAVLVKTDPNVKPAHRGHESVSVRKGAWVQRGRASSRSWATNPSTARSLCSTTSRAEASGLIGGEAGKGFQPGGGRSCAGTDQCRGARLGAGARRAERFPALRSTA